MFIVVVFQVGAERKISFDNGPDGSVAEDCFFGMKAYAEGYTFNFIEGEMWEKSPFTMWDFLQQRKRWMQVICSFTHTHTLYLAPITQTIGSRRLVELEERQKEAAVALVSFYSLKTCYLFQLGLVKACY